MTKTVLLSCLAIAIGLLSILSHRNAAVVAVSDQTTCYKSLDLVFLLDASASLIDSEWKLEVDFAERLSKSFEISPKGTHIGVIYFGTVSFEQISVNGEDGRNQELILEKLKDLRTTLRYKNLTRQTRTDLALWMAHEMFQMTPQTRKVPQMLVIVTDGVSSNGMSYLQDPIKKLKGNRVTVVSVGVGLDRLPENFPMEAEKELKFMASKDDLYFRIGNFDKLPGEIKGVLKYVCPEICLRKSDLIFAMDKSGSVQQTGWQEEVNFVKNFLSQFNVSTDGAHVGIIAFGSDAKTYIDMNTKGMNKAELSYVLRLLENEYKDPFAATFTHLALERAAKMMRGSSRNVQKVLIIITDGRSSMPDKLPKQIKALAQLNVATFSIGVGHYYHRKELLKLANYHEKRVIEIADFADMAKAIGTVTKVICKEEQSFK